MSRLIDAVFSGFEEEIVSFVQLFGDLEFYLGALGFQDRASRGRSRGVPPRARALRGRRDLSRACSIRCSS